MQGVPLRIGFCAPVGRGRGPVFKRHFVRTKVYAFQATGAPAGRTGIEIGGHKHRSDRRQSPTVLVGTASQSLRRSRSEGRVQLRHGRCSIRRFRVDSIPGAWLAWRGDGKVKGQPTELLADQTCSVLCKVSNDQQPLYLSIV